MQFWTPDRITDVKPPSVAQTTRNFPQFCRICLQRTELESESASFGGNSGNKSMCRKYQTAVAPENFKQQHHEDDFSHPVPRPFIKVKSLQQRPFPLLQAGIRLLLQAAGLRHQPSHLLLPKQAQSELDSTTADKPLTCCSGPCDSPTTYCFTGAKDFRCPLGSTCNCKSK